MSLDAPKTDAELLRLHAERTAGYVRVGNLLPSPPTTMTTTHRPGDPLVYVRISDWPISLRIPWSCLVSDNRKYGVLKGKMIAQKPYREAKKRIRALAADAMQARPPAACPLSLTARVWMPDKRPHDLTNWCKLIHDALETVCYANDSWLHRVTWERAGVDVDAPRCELTLSPLPSPEPG